MKKREIATLAVVGAVALVGGIFLGIQINSASTSSEVKQGVKESSVDCNGLQAMTTMIVTYSPTWDRGALQLMIQANGITDVATDWTSNLGTKDKETFRNLRQSTEAVASETFMYHVALTNTWEKLKTSLKAAYSYCHLDPSYLDHHWIWYPTKG